MNSLVHRYFYEDQSVQAVLIFSEGFEKKWIEVKNLAPNCPRGWFELSLVSAEDRIEFLCAFWQKSLPFHPKAHLAIYNFFNSLDDVVVVLIKARETWVPQLIYSFADNSCFFRGEEPVLLDEVNGLIKELNFALPADWNAFTKIHNGFGKLSELNILKISQIPSARRKVQKMILNANQPVKSGGMIVDPGALVPFSEVVGLNSFQCFYEDWYPSNEMGNVYFSGIDYTLSDIRRRENWEENGAFPTFVEWLIAYLEGMEIAP